MTMNDFSKYIDEISKPVEFSPKGDIGPVGDICPIASDSHDFCYDFDRETSSVNDEEDEEDFDATEFKYLTDYEMHEQRKRDDNIMIVYLKSTEIQKNHQLCMMKKLINSIMSKVIIQPI